MQNIAKLFFLREAILKPLRPLLSPLQQRRCQVLVGAPTWKKHQRCQRRALEALTFLSVERCCTISYPRSANMSIAHSPSKTLSRHLVATPVPQAFQYCTTTLSGAHLITAKHKSHKEPLKCWGSIWFKVIQIFIPIRPTYGEFLPLKPMLSSLRWWTGFLLLGFRVCQQSIRIGSNTFLIYLAQYVSLCIPL